MDRGSLVALGASSFRSTGTGLEGSRSQRGSRCGQVQAQIRRSMGVTERPRQACDDPAEAYFEPGSITRQVHSDLPAMLIGGIAALLLQMLHPLAMAGVAQHSNYRKDPLGRLERTAGFLGATTFLSRAEAEAAIARVRTVHSPVVGTAPDGRPYAASDPDLVCWVHACEVRSFLSASTTYGPRRLTPDEQDRYLDEMARVAMALGADGRPPHRGSTRPLLRNRSGPSSALTREARTARNFVLKGVGRWPHEMTTYGLLVAARPGRPAPVGHVGSSTWSPSRPPTDWPCGRRSRCSAMRCAGSPRLRAGEPTRPPSLSATERGTTPWAGR